MFADGANKILRKIFIFVDITTNFANPALLFFRFLLRLYVGMVIGVSHTRLIVPFGTFFHGTEEDCVGGESNGIFHF